MCYNIAHLVGQKKKKKITLQDSSLLHINCQQSFLHQLETVWVVIGGLRWFLPLFI